MQAKKIDAKTGPATLPDRAVINNLLQARPLVFVGMPGCGKSAIGRRVAGMLERPFFDADHEIEKEAQRTIAEIFTRQGEAFFRRSERRTITQLLDHTANVIATGGGAFMDDEIRARVRGRAVSVWLRADLDTLTGRVAGKTDRPLLLAGDPRTILGNLMNQREATYAMADITIQTGDDPHMDVVGQVLEAVRAYLESRK